VISTGNFRGERQGFGRQNYAFFVCQVLKAVVNLQQTACAAPTAERAVETEPARGFNVIFFVLNSSQCIVVAASTGRENFHLSNFLKVS
jgi:hypothetical protein